MRGGSLFLRIAGPGGPVNLQNPYTVPYGALFAYAVAAVVETTVGPLGIAAARAAVNPLFSTGRGQLISGRNGKTGELSRLSVLPRPAKSPDLAVTGTRKK